MFIKFYLSKQAMWEREKKIQLSITSKTILSLIQQPPAAKQPLAWRGHCSFLHLSIALSSIKALLTNNQHRCFHSSYRYNRFKFYSEYTDKTQELNNSWFLNYSACRILHFTAWYDFKGKKLNFADNVISQLTD